LWNASQGRAYAKRIPNCRLKRAWGKISTKYGHEICLGWKEPPFSYQICMEIALSMRKKSFKLKKSETAEQDKTKSREQTLLD